MMTKLVWLFIWCLLSALWIAEVQNVQTENKSAENFYKAVKAKFSQVAVNCTEFIPEDWRLLMLEHEPPNDPTYGMMLAPLEYLLQCLHAKLVNMNETAPFSFTARPYIQYNIALNEVVSLGFDGILITKAWNFHDFYNLSKLQYIL